MERSSLKLVSNIILKSEYEKDHRKYLPFDLLPKEYNDVRLDNQLTDYQRQQKLKNLFAAQYTITDD